MSKILGIDEVGRGPWAGPLVVGACVLHEEIPGLTDSKKLSAKRRVELNEVILAGSSWGLGWVSAAELDEIGLSAALRKAAVEAVRKIDCSYGEIIIDGMVNFLAETGKGRYVTTLAKADLLIPAVSAAAIVAKVARDRYMAEVAEKYPEYGFEKHVGYGTKIHMHCLREYGPCPEHRRSFRPVAVMITIGDSSEDTSGEAPVFTGLRPSRSAGNRGVARPSSTASLESPSLSSHTTRAIGDKAETKVAEYLGELGHEVVARNWKTRMCEVDIVSVLGGKIYFTEVKYRRDGQHGTGLEVVTAEKLRQMKFAAESFMKFQGETLQQGFTLKSLEPLLAVASVGGPDFRVEDFLVLQ